MGKKRRKYVCGLVTLEGPINSRLIFERKQMLDSFVPRDVDMVWYQNHCCSTRINEDAYVRGTVLSLTFYKGGRVRVKVGICMWMCEKFCGDVMRKCRMFSSV